MLLYHIIPTKSAATPLTPDLFPPEFLPHMTKTPFPPVKSHHIPLSTNCRTGIMVGKLMRVWSAGIRTHTSSCLLASPDRTFGPIATTPNAHRLPWGCLSCCRPSCGHIVSVQQQPASPAGPGHPQTLASHKLGLRGPQQIPLIKSDQLSKDRQLRSPIFFPRSDRDRRSSFSQKIVVRSAIAKSMIGIAKICLENRQNDDIIEHLNDQCS